MKTRSVVNSPKLEMSSDPGTTKLLNAAKAGDFETLQQAIDEGGNVDVVNWEEETPLHLATKKGAVDCVKALLEAGSKQSINTVSSRGFTPLGLAIRTKKSHGFVTSEPTRLELAKTLMSAEADPLVALRSFSNVLEGVDLDAMRTLTDAESIFASPTPILSSFRLGHALKRLANLQPERRIEYDELANACEGLATDLLSQCRDLWDVRRLLSLTNGSTVMKTALKLRQKQFISHQFTQEYLNELWLREYYGGKRSYKEWSFSLLAYLGFFVAVPYRLVMYYFFERTRTRGVLTYSKLGDLIKLYKTPFFKYFGNVISFMTFVALCLFNCASHVENIPSVTEIVLAVWVVALALVEIRESYRTMHYFEDRWNQLDIIMIFMFIAVIGVRVFVWQQPLEHNQELMFASNSVFGIATAIACLRLLNMMQAHQLLGPLQLIIAYIIQDLTLFFIFLILFMLSFSAALTKIYEFDEVQQLSSFQRTAETLFWFLFGLVELDVFDSQNADAEIRQATTSLGKILLGIYMILISILLINLLIAMMTTTFNRIHDNADIEWKYLRARLIIGYQASPVIPAPLNLVLEPIVWIVVAVTRLRLEAVRDDTETRDQDKLQLTKLKKILVQKLKAKRNKQKMLSQETGESLIGLKNQISELSELVAKLSNSAPLSPSATSATAAKSFSVPPGRGDTHFGFPPVDPVAELDTSPFESKHYYPQSPPLK